jgi:hypothetical protein
VVLVVRCGVGVPERAGGGDVGGAGDAVVSATAAAEDAGLASRVELAGRARERLVGALDAPLGGRLRSGGDDAPEKVRIDAHSLLEHCPRRLANPAEDYEDRTSTVRRRLGLLALRRGAETSGAPGGRSDPPLSRSVAEVMADRAGWSAGLRSWLETLEPAGRVAVEAAAHTWATEVARLVGNAPRVRWSDPFLSARWNVPGRSVQLTGATDAMLGTPRTGEKLLVVSDALPGPGDRLRAGHVAVVHALGSGRTPVRVSIGAPASGRVEQVRVDEALVDLVVDRIAEVAGHLADAERAPTVPGRWCSHCHWRDVCEDGAAFLAG